MIFDIRQKIDSEIFKSSSDLAKWPAGDFDYQIILEDINDDYIFDLCEWLAENCSRNFVLVKETSELIAGGSTNNLSKWNRRKERGRDKFDKETVNAFIRLYDDDVTAFRIVWVL